VCIAYLNSGEFWADGFASPLRQPERLMPHGKIIPDRAWGNAIF
jgi:hypothetical protein